MKMDCAYFLNAKWDICPTDHAHTALFVFLDALLLKNDIRCNDQQ